jgi:hypothetical protein
LLFRDKIKYISFFQTHDQSLRYLFSHRSIVRVQDWQHSCLWGYAPPGFHGWRPLLRTAGKTPGQQQTQNNQYRPCHPFKNISSQHFPPSNIPPQNLKLKAQSQKQPQPS